VTPAQARAEAHRILSERRFHGTSLPRPLHGALDWVARHLGFVGRWWASVARAVGGHDVLWSVVGAVCIVVAVSIALRLARRRTGLDAALGVNAARVRAEDPGDLERLAAEAERRGDLEVALRFRFRAGLLRLGRARVLPVRPSLRTGEVRRAVRSPRFDRLARDFDEVVYGRRPPRAADLAAARDEWPRVLDEAPMSVGSTELIQERSRRLRRRRELD
jgi:hypothetical protein